MKILKQIALIGFSLQILALSLPSQSDVNVSPSGPHPLPSRAQRALLAKEGVRPECVITISPTSIFVPYTGGTFSVTVTAQKTH